MVKAGRAVAAITALVGACQGPPCACEQGDASVPAPDASRRVVTVSHLGGGSVRSEPPGIDCGPVCEASFSTDHAIVLLATALDGMSFIGWERDCSGTAACELVGEADQVVRARFEPPRVDWARGYGASSGEHASALVTLPDGSIVVAGEFSVSTTLAGRTLQSAGDRDIFLLKLSSTGSPVWSTRLGGPGQDVVTDLAIDSDGNIVVVGWFTGQTDLGGGSWIATGPSDAFVATYNAAGDYVRAIQVGGEADEQSEAVVITDTDRALVVGSFSSTLSVDAWNLLSAGSRDIFVLEVSLVDRSVLRADRFGATGWDVAHDAVVDADGNAAIVGQFTGDVDFGGGTPLEGTGSDTLFVAGYDPSGAYRFALAPTGTGYSWGLSAGIDADGNVVCAGQFSGTFSVAGKDLSSTSPIEGVVVSVGPNGAARWAAALAGPAEERPRAVSADVSGHVLVGGTFSRELRVDSTILYGVGELDMFVGSLAAADGSLRWTRRLGAQRETVPIEAVTAMAPASGAASWIVVGDFTDSTDFGAATVDSAGLGDVFALQLIP